MKSRIKYHSAGLTLVEVMVAIGITAVMATMIWQTYSTTFEINDKVEKINDLYHQGRVVIGRITREIQSSFIIRTPSTKPYTYFIGKEGPGGNTEVAFVAFTRYPILSSDMRNDQMEIKYFTESTENNLYILKTTRSPIIDGDPDKGGTTVDLIENVKEFKIEYYDPITDEFKKEWDSKINQRDRLPSEVKIRLVLQSREGKLYPFETMVRLPMAAARPGEPNARIAAPTPPAKAEKGGKK